MPAPTRCPDAAPSALEAGGVRAGAAPSALDVDGARGAPAAARPARRTAVQWLLAGVGVALLAALVYAAGPERLARHLAALGWATPLIFVPYAVASALDAAGWRVTFVQARPSFWLLYVVRIAGEAVNNVTPTAYLGGEPVKAYVLRRFGVPLPEAVTSVILAKTALTVAQIAFVILGIALLFLERRTGWSSLPALLGLSALGAAVTAGLVAWQRRGLMALLARGIRRLFPRSPRAARLEARAAEIDRGLRAFYGEQRRAAIASVALHLAGWMVGGAEVWVILELVGHPVSWTTAIAIEALAQPARLAGLVIPGTLGVQEAGGMLIFNLLGLPAELGLTTMLLKRAREIAYSLFGLAVLARLRVARLHAA